MISIHGGGWQAGSGSDPSFDGGNLASRGDIILETINCRLGLSGSWLSTTDGNYAIGDTVTALDWVQANIEDFGGDKERIIVVGQSSGGVSVMALISSPKAKGKFAGAIAQSYTAGSLFGTVYARYYDIQDPVISSFTAAVLQVTNCSSSAISTASQLDCLRALPAYELGNLAPAAGGLTKDGTYLVTNEPLLNVSGGVADVHMIGSMRDDAASFASFPTSTNLTAEVSNLAPYTSLSQGPDTLISSGQFPSQQLQTQRSPSSMPLRIYFPMLHSVARMLRLRMRVSRIGCLRTYIILSLIGVTSRMIGIRVRLCVTRLRLLSIHMVLRHWSISNVIPGICSEYPSSPYFLLQINSRRRV
jgi:hypothetical protein